MKKTNNNNNATLSEQDPIPQYRTTQSAEETVPDCRTAWTISCKLLKPSRTTTIDSNSKNNNRPLCQPQNPSHTAAIEIIRGWPDWRTQQQHGKDGDGRRQSQATTRKTSCSPSSLSPLTTCWEMVLWLRGVPPLAMKFKHSLSFSKAQPLALPMTEPQITDHG